MIRLLDYLVGRTFLGLFFACIVCAPVLFFIGELGERLSRYMDAGLSVPMILWGMTHRIPQYLVWSFPLAALVASVFAIHSMTTHREIVAAKSGGVSFHRLLAPLWALGLILAGIAFWVGESAPKANRRAAEILGEREVRNYSSRSDFVYSTLDGYTLSVERLDHQSGRMSRVSVEQRADDGTLRHLWADVAEYDDARGWTFERGALRLLGPRETEETYSFDRYHTPLLTIRPSELLNERDEEELSYRELTEKAEALERSGQSNAKALVGRDQKIAIPFATLVIILFGAPLATTSKRGGVSFGVGVSLASAILYVLLLQLCGAIGSSELLPPFWAAWAPNALYLAVGGMMLLRIRT